MSSTTAVDIRFAGTAPSRAARAILLGGLAAGILQFFLNGIVGHACLVGLPISLLARRHIGPHVG